MRTKNEKVVAVVRKRIKMIKHAEAKERAFKKEAECLEFFRYLRHKNIIELLATYEYDNEHYLLFPLLSMDLANFLEREQRYGEFVENSTFYKALSGLASAIETIHNATLKNEDMLLTRIGYHHDIRPKNILVTPETFVLTDFGLARLKMPDDDSQTGWKSGIGDYIAPECMNDNWDHQQVGRSIDIWSYGCLLAEVATYMERGCLGVKEFRSERRKTSTTQAIQNSYFFEGLSLRRSVSDWLALVSVKPNDQGVRWLVEVARRMLQVDLKARPKAALVSSTFAYLKMKVLYRSVEGILGQINAKQFQHTCRVSPFARLNIWFEMEKLKAWGMVLGVNTDRTAHELFDKDAAISQALYDILEQLRVRLQAYSAAKAPGRDTREEATPIQTSLEEDLRASIQDLWRAVPLTYQARMEQEWRQSSLNTDDTQMLYAIEEAAHVLPAPFSDIGVHATLRRLELELWRQTQKVGPEQKKLLLRPSQLERQKSLSSYQELGLYHPSQGTSSFPASSAANRRVLVEWIVYSPAWEGQTDEEKITKLLTLAEMLQNPLEGSHVLRCVGVIPPTESLHCQGFGFLYAYPQAIDGVSQREPQILSQLLRNKDYPVLLEHKFEIAKCLSWSVSQLHTVGWLHKNIQSSNIMFFAESSQPASSTVLGEPYLIGFNHSRPDGEIWYSDTDIFNDGGGMEYKDPQYTPGVTRFRKVFDYYSLGIVLLEIGFWQPIAAFQQRHKNDTREEFRRELVLRYAPKLGAKMGSRYMEIVIACLRGSFSESEDGGGMNDANDDFYWSVVAKLSQLKIV
jgi:serine/threonine protein kinase